MVRPMSQREIDHRKRAQGAITRTTSTTGLGAVGLLGASALMRKKPQVAGKLKAIPGLKKATPEKLKNASANTSIATGGIAGIGGYNFAAYTSAEAKQRKAAVKKNQESSHPDMVPHFGEVYESQEISKSWSPNASKFDPEVRRHERNKKTSVAGAAATTGLAGSAVGMSVARKKGKLVAVKATPKKLGAAAAVTGAATGAFEANRRKNKSWRSY